MIKVGEQPVDPEQVLESLLRSGKFLRSFPPALETQYRASGATNILAAMRRSLLLPAFFGAVVTLLLYEFGHSATRPQVAMEWLVNLPAGVLAVALLARFEDARLRMAIFSAGALIRVASLTAERHWAGPHNLVDYVLVGGMLMVSFLLVVPLRIGSTLRFLAVLFPVYVLSALLPGSLIGARWDMLLVLILQFPALLRVRAQAEIANRRSFLLALRDRARVQQLEAVNRQLTVLMESDALTGVGNRRSFDRTLQTALASTSPICLLIIDVDYFKSYNDSLGHQKGDECLRRLAQLFRQTVPEQDHVSRYGGEEFAIIIPKATLWDGHAVAERVRSRVEACALEHQARPDELGFVTVSIGVAHAPSIDVKTEELLGKADRALYAAKAAGRNSVRVVSRDLPRPQAALPIAADSPNGGHRNIGGSPETGLFQNA